MSSDAEVTTSPVVATVYEHLLDSITRGDLQPGDRISDAELAKEFGVSRTPVREAIQRLRDIGVIEASANRFTRVAVVAPEQTAKAMTVWIALFCALVNEVVENAASETADAMERDHEAFLAALEREDYPAMARANFDFYDRLATHSNNEVLLRSLTSVVHMVRLGSLYLPEAIDVSQLSRWQRDLLDAVRRRDTKSAVTAVEGLRGIQVPLD
ncbi:MAG: GntR family transcriptional regulator [Salinibacterium sp.]|nr:GntR family transcriptional regulator [Salinibacterium sp.]MBF0672427.1 GntR family transcriptional regulator [Salinibacterium sp.]